MKKIEFYWSFGLVCSFLLLYGCASVPLDLRRGSILGEGGLRTTRQVLKNQRESARPQTREELKRQEEEVQDAISIDFGETMQACNKIFTGFEQTATTLRWTSFTIAMVGTIAGSVVVPALSAANAAAFRVAIAAFGGLSGAANSAQSVLGKQGLTAEETIRVRDQLRAKFDVAMEEYFKGYDDKDKRRAALEKATAACVSYAIQSASAVITSDTTGPKPPGGSSSSSSSNPSGGPNPAPGSGPRATE